MASCDNSNACCLHLAAGEQLQQLLLHRQEHWDPGGISDLDTPATPHQSVRTEEAPQMRGETFPSFYIRPTLIQPSLDKLLSCLAQQSFSSTFFWKIAFGRHQHVFQGSIHCCSSSVWECMYEIGLRTFHLGCDLTCRQTSVVQQKKTCSFIIVSGEVRHGGSGEELWEQNAVFH